MFSVGKVYLHQYLLTRIRVWDSSAFSILLKTTRTLNTLLHFFISQIVQDIIKYKMSFTSIILIKADHLLLQPSCSVKYL